ncbi:MAG: proline--tRNA ligase [Deltaproteobacteria bacterium]|nr:proline--tRNA ligase [Deltaproteobacteria bacterium]MBW2121246.1 proline--tRNA ligase [Deltaproteobacteria bacterium]
MRYSQFFLPTLREDPAEAEIVSHKIMFRAGMIRKVSSGIYALLPLGWRVYRKVEAIIREEMNRAGAQEVYLPAVHPAELWQETGRWQEYGKELLRMTDRHDRQYCFGPTHEEVITDLARREIRSYRQMPLNLFQIQVKFRDEIRPRFGVMRSREFIMKDAYSFDVDEEASSVSYWKMYEAYRRIFTRCGLNFKPVEAESGLIGGSFSHEFMALAGIGEETIASCTSCDYAANVKKAEIFVPDNQSPPEREKREMEKVSTPEIKTIEALSDFLKTPPQNLVKTLIFESDRGAVAALVRGDHDVNEIKLMTVLNASHLELASDEVVERETRSPKGFAGPIGLKIPLIADYALKNMVNFVTGANEKDAHLINVNWGRDFHVDRFADIRMAVEGDRCPRCGEVLRFDRGIEVGQVFKLGTKYSEAMHATYLDDKGNEKPIVMGCYGIGPVRTIAAIIEQHHDADGVIFPMSVAPFHVSIVPVNEQNRRLMETAERLTGELEDRGVEVLLDDRAERPGVKFKDADLIGIPLRITLGERNFAEGRLEVRHRETGETTLLDIDRASETISRRVEEILGSYMPD